jgi:hypothetical protein
MEGISALNETTRKAVHMRSMFKPILGVLVTVLALSAVASASASAEACKKKAGAKSYILCIAGERIGSPTLEKIESIELHLKSGTSGRIVVPFAEGTSATVTCTTLREGGAIHTGGGSSAGLAAMNLKFEHCKTTFSAGGGCAVKEPSTWRGITGTFGPLAENVRLPMSVRESMWMEGAECPQTYYGEWSFSDTTGPECTLTEAEVEKIEKLLVCKGEKSHLKLVTFNANAELGFEETVILTGEHKGQKFSIVESS